MWQHGRTWRRCARVGLECVFCRAVDNMFSDGVRYDRAYRQQIDTLFFGYGCVGRDGIYSDKRDNYII